MEEQLLSNNECFPKYTIHTGMVSASLVELCPSDIRLLSVLHTPTAEETGFPDQLCVCVCVCVFSQGHVNCSEH